MTREEIKELFMVDSEGKFINLIIPEKNEYPQLNLIGRNQLDLTLDEVVRVKQYAAYLYKNAKNNI